MPSRKSEKADLRRFYTTYVQIGLVVALLLLVVGFRINWSPESDFEVEMVEQEIVEMEEIQQTKQEVAPPPPPRPPVPVEVPNDEIMDDVDLDLDASLDINEPVADVPPPPPAEEEPEEAEPEIFVVVEEMPQLQGGLASLQQCVQYPEMAKRAGVEGRVIVQFVVDEQGNVVDPVVVRGIGAGADEEALRCVRQAKFTPGKQRGKAVQVKMSLPVSFRLR